ncbi:unnamed protein product, partial [Phaeothamnion confervicola]
MAIVPTGGSFTLPFVARDEQLFQMWEYLHSNHDNLLGGNQPVKVSAQRTPIMYFQASPGVGKTRLLLELCRSDPKDSITWTSMPRPHFLPISFNGVTSISLAELDIVSRLDLSYLPLAILRVVYTEACTADRVSWLEFVAVAKKSLVSGELKDVNHFGVAALQNLLSARQVGADVPKVFLVDEITKLDVAMVGAQAADTMRKMLSSLADDMRASVIFSTLDERVITRERATPSNRRVKSLSLPLLPVENGTDLLQTIAIATLQEVGLEEQVDRELLRHGCRVLAAAGLGHGRTIEYMASALKKEIIRQRLDWLAGDVFDSEPIIRAAISAVWETYGREALAPTEVLVAAVLGKLVRSGDIAFLR